MSRKKVSHKLLETLIDEALVGFIVVNRDDHKPIYANHKAKEILHLNENDLIKNIEELIPTEMSNKKYRAMSLDLFEHEGLFQEVVMRRSDGQNFIASCGVRHVDFEDDDLMVLMIQDTTLQAKMQREIENKQMQIKEAYEELLQQNRQLKELDIAKNRFIALVTHELRTPTSAVVATSEMLKLGIYDDDAQMKEFVGMIYDEGRHLLELINDILDFAKIQSGRMDYWVEQKDVNDILDHAAESLESLAEQSDVALKYERFSEDLLCYFDVHRLKQVVTNLLSNGIKYNKKGGEVHLYAEKLEKVIRIHIKDNGKGISPENQKLIFNEFETLGKMASHSKGTGLGLPISKRMIESMGGSIELESEEGVGSDFWINVPIEKVLDDPDMYRSREENEIEDLAA